MSNFNKDKVRVRDNSNTDTDDTDKGNGNSNNRREIILDDKLRDLIVNIVSETVSKSLKETMKVFVDELKSEINKSVREASPAPTSGKVQKTSSTLNKELFRTIKINRQRIVENKILNLIKEEGMLLSDLKFLIVDQLKYCSKASFYRYIDHLNEKEVIFMKGRGKRNFIFKNIKNIMR